MVSCPYCQALMSQVGAEGIGVGGRWHGVGYTCPYCFKRLSVSVDPVSLKTDTVSEVVEYVDNALAPILSVLQRIVNRLNQMP